jgi:hypothetical protein
MLLEVSSGKESKVADNKEECTQCQLRKMTDHHRNKSSYENKAKN